MTALGCLFSFGQSSYKLTQLDLCVCFVKCLFKNSSLEDIIVLFIRLCYVGVLEINFFILTLGLKVTEIGKK